jgi:hypothetical protein
MGSRSTVVPIRRRRRGRVSACRAGSAGGDSLLAEQDVRRRKLVADLEKMVERTLEELERLARTAA